MITKSNAFLMRLSRKARARRVMSCFDYRWKLRPCLKIGYCAIILIDTATLCPWCAPCATVRITIAIGANVCAEPGLMLGKLAAALRLPPASWDLTKSGCGCAQICFHQLKKGESSFLFSKRNLHEMTVATFLCT